MRATLLKSMSVLLGLVLIGSLIMNYMYYRRERHDAQYIRLLYNQFIFYTNMSADSLGKVNPGSPDYQRAAVDTSDAANALSALEHYESLVQNPGTAEPSTPHVKQIANFLSYVSLALVKKSPEFETNSGPFMISPSSAKTLVVHVDNILMSNINIKDSNIPTDKVPVVFDQIYNLIPKSFQSQNMLDFFYH